MNDMHKHVTKTTAKAWGWGDIWLARRRDNGTTI